MISNQEVKKVDFGFSIHKESDDQTLSVLYSSFQEKEFDLNSETGEVRCEINSFPFSAGNYRIGVRILVDHVESDWPRIPIMRFTVIEGDFFNTGKIGFGSTAPILLKGNWEIFDSFN
jgi:lipopolysaccharide transport system ATP-binding protein